MRAVRAPYAETTTIRAGEVDHRTRRQAAHGSRCRARRNWRACRRASARCWPATARCSSSITRIDAQRHAPAWTMRAGAEGRARSPPRCATSSCAAAAPNCAASRRSRRVKRRPAAHPARRRRARGAHGIERRRGHAGRAVPPRNDATPPLTAARAASSLALALARGAAGRRAGLTRRSTWNSAATCASSCRARADAGAEAADRRTRRRPGLAPAAGRVVRRAMRKRWPRSRAHCASDAVAATAVQAGRQWRRVGLDAFPERLRPYRYLLSPTLDTQRVRSRASCAEQLRRARAGPRFARRRRWSNR